MPMELNFRSTLLVCLLFVLSSCSSAPTKPDLARIYKLTTSNAAQTPVIIVHGILGSKLWNTKTQKELWPGDWRKILFSDYDFLSLEINPETFQSKVSTTQPSSIFRNVFGTDYYGKIIDTLINIGGYQISTPDDLINDKRRRVYIFTYDWRQDLVTSAGQLDLLIKNIQKQYKDDKLKVDIVAHSMGGLLSRYYLMYGNVDVLQSPKTIPNFAGAKNVRKYIQIGVPNLGSVKGLQTFLMGFEVGFNAMSPVTLASFPSMYQLLPHPLKDWMISPNGKKLERDLYSLKTWRDYKWSIFSPESEIILRKKWPETKAYEKNFSIFTEYFKANLARAKSFHLAISKPMKGHSLKTIVIGGDCHLTPARCLVETVKGKAMVRLSPNEITNKVDGVNYEQLMLEPGDNSVTKPSLLGKNTLDPSDSTTTASMVIDYSIFLCQSHDQLPGDIAFQDNLLNIILSQETSEDRFNKLNSKSF